MVVSLMIIFVADGYVALCVRLYLIAGGERVARSAGVEQIVALSLIESLNHLGRRKGPMFMDTPAGRLDKKHRENIMEYLPKVVTQLVILAHSGELEEDNIYFDQSKIGKNQQTSTPTSNQGTRWHDRTRNCTCSVQTP